jgi:hypothetical protein
MDLVLSFRKLVHTRNTLLPLNQTLPYWEKGAGDQLSFSGQIAVHCPYYWRPAEKTAESNRVRCLPEAAAEREIATTRWSCPLQMDPRSTRLLGGLSLEGELDPGLHA